MPWLLIVGVLIQFLGPILKEWLERLLTQSAQELDRQGLASFDYPFEGMARLFAEARRQTAWWNWGRRAALHRLESLLYQRAPEVWQAAALGIPMTSISTWEREQLGKNI